MSEEHWLPRTAASGTLASVLAIRPCPPIEYGPGRVITGTFHHTSGVVGDLVLEGEPDSIGVTPSHPFWSVDRQAWIPAGQLVPGERLKTLKGTTTVVSFRLRKSRQPVCNIEVEGDHVYRVGNSGVLVHNVSAPPPNEDYGCEKESGHGRLNPCTSGLLRNQLGGCPADFAAHHLIACQVRNAAPQAMERAAQLGFDINGELNGWCLPRFEKDVKPGLPYTLRWASQWRRRTHRRLLWLCAIDARRA